MTIHFEQIRYRYPSTNSDTWNVSIDSFSIQPGEFVLLIGSSGAGKSTFLRILQGLIPDFYGGLLQIHSLNHTFNSGFVMQDPEQQIIMPDVLGELVFGMEQLGFSRKEMDRRLEHVQSWLPVQSWQNREVQTLSTGEKQRLLIGAISLTDPDLFILDEPIAHLDVQCIQKLTTLVRDWISNKKHSLIVADHRIEHWLPLATRVIMMDKGSIIWDGSVDHWFDFAVNSIFWRDWLPLTKRATAMSITEENQLKPKQSKLKNKPIDDIHINRLTCAYENNEIILNNIQSILRSNSLTALFGPNGSGKSTFLRALAGLITPIQGTIQLQSGLDLTNWSPAERSRWFGYVSQNPYDHLIHDSISKELDYSISLMGLDRSLEQGRFDQICDALELSSNILNAHPRDLSSGERHRAALATVLIRRPLLLLMDEPTSGLSIRQKNQFVSWLISYRESGGTALISSHDLDFTAEWANHVWLLQSSGTRDYIQLTEYDAERLFKSPGLYQSSLVPLTGHYQLTQAVQYLRSQKKGRDQQ